MDKSLATALIGHPILRYLKRSAVISDEKREVLLSETNCILIQEIVI